MKKIVFLTIFMLVASSISISFESTKSNDIANLNIKSTRNVDINFQGGISFSKHIIDNNFMRVSGLYCCDIDNDGDKDIIGAALDSNKVVCWYNNISENVVWTKQTVDNLIQGAIYVYASDIDGDDLIDILATSAGLGLVLWYKNNGGNPIEWSRHYIEKDYYLAHGIFSIDLDNDGDNDIIATSAGYNCIDWWENTGFVGGDISWIKHSIDDNFGATQSVCAADLDNDGNIDVIGASSLDNQFAWYKNSGGDTITWRKNVIDSSSSVAHWVEACDIDHNGRIDILGASYGNNAITCFINQEGNPINWKKQSISQSFQGALVVHGSDIDDDGFNDILGAANIMDTISWWRNDGIDQSNWEENILDSSFDGAWPIYSSDFDNDGDIDIVGGADVANEVAWWENSLYNRPIKPNKPIGEISGVSGKEYSYKTSSIDPDGDQIYYLFDWGDNSNSDWIGPYNSNEDCIVEHIWDEQNNYTIRVKAKDTTGSESIWSDPLTITMPKKMVKSKNTDYWALLVGVSEIANSPDLNLPYENILIEELRNMLLVSDFWHEDHIKSLTGKDATYRNIINGFKWLYQKADEDDICLFYISTHGGGFFDLPPFDEDGGLEEVLFTWSSGKGLGNIFNRFPDLPIGIPIFGSLPYIHDISDDQLKNLINKLDVKGVCAIIDACYSGGFNDYESLLKNSRFLKKINYKSYQNWAKSFAEEINGPGKVILMACEEDKLAQSTCFSYFLIQGFQGNSDMNNDGFCSVEEAFNYSAPSTKSWLKEHKNFEQNPQIYDDYQGELILTEKQLPPVYPSEISGIREGIINIDQNFIFHCIDPDGDRIRLFIDWGDGKSEFSDFFNSNETINITHIWKTEGTYNVWVFSEDEYGSQKYFFGLPNYCFTITIYNNSIYEADQYQMKIYQPEGFNDNIVSNNVWQAQSFIPSCKVLSNVHLWIYSLMDNETNIKISIRDNLTGEDLTFVTNQIPIFNRSKQIQDGWTIFDFPDIEVTPGKTYYIICKSIGDDESFWLYGDPSYINSDEDPYTLGKGFISINKGRLWKSHEIYVDDFCFVTYGHN